jgi:pimeloyl-ACP methyl ester carboxylesterase
VLLVIEENTMPNAIQKIIPSAVPTKWRAPVVLGAAALAASFLYVRAKTRQAEEANPPDGKFVDVDGVRLHYREYGQGPALVLLHGNGILAHDFDVSGLTERAATHYRVIAFDRPGFGHSERPRSTIWTPLAQARLLHAALQRIGVDKPIVLGHSWGTLVALSMALEFPDTVRGLVLLSGYYYPSLRLDSPMSSPPAIPIIGDVLRFTVAPLLGRLMWPLLAKAIFSPVRVPERFRRLPVWMMLRPSQLRASAAESALMVPSAMLLRKRYPELAMPVTIIAGTGDLIANVRHNAQQLHDAIAHSELRLQPDIGHMVHYSRPDEIVAAIDALHASLAQPRALPSVGDAATDTIAAVAP